MTGSDFRGVFPYLVSPVDSSGEIKADVLARLCDDLVKAGVHGLTPLGSTGEFAYLSWPQRRRVVEIVVDSARGRVPVIAGVASTTIADAVSQARECEHLGCSGILAILEAYFPVSDEGVFAYFSAIAEAVSVPLVLYTNPRGITIKSQAVALPLRAADGRDYTLNLVDTPGHVDFTYEVSRAISSCEGAVLLIDATQGVEAQTLANLYLAMEHNLTVVPVINKIDLPGADVDAVRRQIDHDLGLDSDRHRHRNL